LNSIDSNESDFEKEMELQCLELDVNTDDTDLPAQSSQEPMVLPCEGIVNVSLSTVKVQVVHGKESMVLPCEGTVSHLFRTMFYI